MRRVVVTRTALRDLLHGGTIGRTRALDHDPARDVVIVCTNCEKEGTVPRKVVPDQIPRDGKGRVLGLCPRCSPPV